MAESKRRAPINKLAGDYETALQELVKNKERKCQEIEKFEEDYGKKLNKINEPEKPNKTLWDFVLTDIEKTAASYINSSRDAKRFQAKKLCKAANHAAQKLEKLGEEKVNAKIRYTKELSKNVAKKVYKDFWQAAFKIHKFSVQQQSKMREREDQKKRLDNLIKQQVKLSSQLAEVLVPINATASAEKLQEEEAKNKEENMAVAKVEPNQPTMLAKRKPVILKNKGNTQNGNGGVIIELTKSRKKIYTFSRVIYDEQRLKEEQSKPRPAHPSTALNPHSIQPPILLNGSLRYYQFIGLKWLLSLHQKRLNGILADEMGLGKTIQTIALLAYLAGELGIWGPHLVVVPTTLLLNWEMEFKRWAPGMKIFTYFGRLSERKEKRKGWSQINSFQVCITSYKIATLESKVFRRRKWYYLILDEAQQIKNSSSQTWQCLSNFQTVRRLLLTGTPLQNNLIELWSLLAFLIPDKFESYSDFKDWFSEPLQRALQSNQVVNTQIIENLHNILRPILLRRLKKDVEKELPKKTEVVIKVPLSMRQRYLYDEFISQDIRRSNNNDFLNLMNLLMHLRKTCNHPDLVQPKDVESGFSMDPLAIHIHSKFLLDLKGEDSLVETELDAWQVKEIQRLIPSIESYEGQLTLREEEILKGTNSFNRDLKLAYAQQRTYNVIHRLDCFKKSFAAKLVINYHYLKMRLGSLGKEDKVKKLLYKLGRPTFDQLLSRFYYEAEEFLIYYHPAVTSHAKVFTFPYVERIQKEIQTLREGQLILKPVLTKLRPFSSRMQFQFPKQKNVIYDSGKLNRLVHILRDLRAKKHKCLIFTQVTSDSYLDVKDAGHS